MVIQAGLFEWISQRLGHTSACLLDAIGYSGLQKIQKIGSLSLTAFESRRKFLPDQDCSEIPEDSLRAAPADCIQRIADEFTPMNLELKS